MARKAVSYGFPMVFLGVLAMGMTAIQAVRAAEPGQLVLTQSAPPFTFAAGAEDWTFKAPSSPSYVAPLHEAVAGEPGFLRLQAEADNTNTFGFWESPLFQIPGVGPDAVAAPGAIRLPADTTGNTIFTARCWVKSNVADAGRVPQLRFRSTSASLSKSAMLVIDSQADGAVSPTPEGRRYDLWFVPSPDSLGFRLDFEMLNFNPLDDPNGSLELDTAELWRVEPWSMTGLRAEKTYTFDDGAEGWTFFAPPQFTAPGYTVADSALVLVSRPGDNTFGYWTSPAAGATMIESGRMYIARFRVASDVADKQMSKVPGFRCRIHEGSFHAGAVVAVESVTGEVSPVVDSPREFDVYFEPPAASAGQPLILAFDMTKFAFGDSDTAQLRLEEVTVFSAALP